MPEIRIIPAESEADMAAARELFTAYAESFGYERCFENFQEELAGLPGEFAPPRGRLLLARDGSGAALGCVGIRPRGLDVCEMRRLYVVPSARGQGLGRRLAVAVIEAAREAGYRFMRLDTVPATMPEAMALYYDLGFQAFPTCRFDPTAGVSHLQLDLTK